CVPGHYCTDGAKFPCPAGTFGSSVDETSYSCSGPCPAGHFCPEGTSSTRQAQDICREGHYCREGVMSLCPAGTFGETEGLQDVSCSGPCPAGWYCPAGTVNSFALPCGGPRVFCPEGSRRPLPVDLGHY
ncbi:unnamed protein product, partial [Sphacelaria rigidula]